LLATITPSKKGGDDEQMHLRPRPCQWSCEGIEAIHVASPDAACPEVHRKQLDAAIGRLIAMYCPEGRHGNNQQNIDTKCTHFAGHFDAYCDAAV
jgi:hypothetical protein